MEPSNPSSNSFANAVVGQGIPTLGKLGVGNSGTGDDSLVITKKPGRTIEGNTIRTKGVTEVHDLFHGSAGGNKLTAISGSFNLSLALGKPINGSLINHVNNPGGRTTSSEVMHEIGIFEGGGADRFAFGRGQTIR